MYDADSLKLLRRIGTGGKNHFLTTPGDFGAPQGVAVDGDGNVYVTDTLNNRVEIFDADGNFVSEFGKHGDGPGYLARPKGIAVDGDGHIWVADQMEDRLQVFNREGQLLTYVGTGHGELPGQFKALDGSSHRQAKPGVHHRTGAGTFAGLPLCNRCPGGGREGEEGCRVAEGCRTPAESCVAAASQAGRNFSTESAGYHASE